MLAELHNDSGPGEDVPLILIVDDDAEHRLLVRHALRTENYRLIEAADGAEALEIAEAQRPELIIVDALMPTLDGFEACARIRSTDWGRDTLILMVTGLDDEASVRRAFEAGADDYINKPINRLVLRQRVGRTLLNSRAEKKLLRIAYEDTLTGLPNRRLFMDRLEQALVRAGRSNSSFGVLFIDLDRFKFINDSLGHEAGDNVLKLLSERLAAALRASDTIARLGGDEFTVLAEGVDNPYEVGRVADKLAQAAAEPMQVKGRELAVTLSIGAAMFPQDGNDIGHLLKSADVAMYRAKHKGRNGLQFFSSESSASALSHLEKERDLQEAFKREEFVVHYQPIVSVAENKVVGVEALIRWNSPSAEIISAGKFIPLIEESDLIVPLGEWVIRTVCRQCSTWRSSGYDIRTVSVNLSTREFKEEGMVAKLGSILEETQLEAGSLEFEIMEHTLMQDPQEVEARLNDLHALGVKIAIDDFGTGWTSLAYLAQFPINTLKIDRSFTKAIPAERHAVAMVKAAVLLGRALKIDVLAEGVENDEQLNVLKELGCDRAQGHYWSASLPASEFENQFLKGR